MATTGLLNMGMTLTEGGFRLGWFNPATQLTEVFMDDLLEITFVGNHVIVGMDCDEFPLNRVNLYEKMKTVGVSTRVVDPTGTRNIDTQEMLNILYRHMTERMQIKFPSETIGNLVIATEFTTNEATREGLEVAGKLAGFRSTQVIPCTLATGVAHVRLGSGNYTARNCLVIQYFKHSFTMAVLQIKPEGITQVISVGSTDLKECSTDMFLKLHGHLATGGNLCKDQRSYIENIYAKTVQYVNAVTNQKLGPIDEMIYTSPFPDTKIDAFIANLLWSTRLNIENPSLTGACIVATLNDSEKFRIKVQNE